MAGADHVLIGRAGGIERPYAELAADLIKALGKLRAKTVRPEPVEGLSFVSDPNNQKKRASTGSARTGGGSSE
jgi:ribonuclease P protein component